MDWALSFYKIPALKDDVFFSNIDIDNQDFWDSIKYRMEWTEKLVPFYQWNNICFVACLERSLEKLPKNIVPILVSQKVLNTLWNKFQQFCVKEEEVEEKETFSKDTEVLYPLDNQTKVTKSKGTSGNFLKKSVNLLNTVIHNTALSKLVYADSVEDDSYQYFFQKSEKFFSDIIVFAILNNEFIPLEWTSSLEGNKSRIKIDQQPSVFKMIVTSRSPYHGIIMNNKVHSKFFSLWGFDALPKHVSLIPIMEKSKNIVGAFMGIANKSVDRKYLYEIMSWSQPLIEAIKKDIKNFEKLAG